jgi:chromosomal replication initiator protein
MAQPVTKSMDWDALWLTARERMRREMGDAVFDAWIRSLSFISAEGTDVKIGALTPFARNWVAGHHVQRIERALAAESGQAVTINLIVAPQRPSVAPVVTPPREPVVAQVTESEKAEGRRILSTKILQNAQTFESFVPGPANEFAFRAAKALGSGENEEISLLYVHGGFGYGKSHLLNAIALEARKRGKRALFLGAEDFMRQFLGALNRKETLGFKEDLRAADILLIEDLQHLCRSTNTDSEFLHTMNAFSD